MHFVIVHGWGGHPDEAWFPWLKSELESKGHTVEIPQMPDTDHPSIETWVPFLAEKIRNPEETFLVGHSIGCQTILRYLDKAEGNIKKVVHVAGWVNLKKDAFIEPEDIKIAEPWLKTPINWDKVGKTESVAIFSTNDPYVPIEDAEIFKEKGSEVIILEKRGHLGASDNAEVVPEILEAIHDLL